MAKTILSVEHLTVQFDHEIIIQDINFTVDKQNVLIILGPNGAGKTTLLRALLGLVPYTGSINWKTKNISYLPPQELLFRKDLPPLTIKEFFLFKQVSEQDIHYIIDAVGLPKSILSQEFTTLSTGQFQRMMIAWALVHKPDVLLFDEPTAGIDIGGKETIYSLLHTFWKEWQLTIILVTHNLQMVWEHATDILCLNKKMMCYGPPKDVLTAELLKKIYGTGVKWYEHLHNS